LYPLASIVAIAEEMATASASPGRAELDRLDVSDSSELNEPTICARGRAAERVRVDPVRERRPDVVVDEDRRVVRRRPR
jgi:hypothetical protein